MKIQYRIKNVWLWMLFLCIPFAVMSCESDVHENESGGLSVALAWQDTTDETTARDIRVWIYYAADGSLVKSLQYTDVRSLASERYQLNSGAYQVVTAVNLTSPFSVGNATNINDLLFSLSEASASPQHAFYGVAEATVSSNNAVTVVTDSLHRMMSELSVTIHNAPASSVLTGTVNNAATGFYPCKAQTNTDQATVTLPKTTAQGTTIQTGTIRLMPTANGQGKTKLALQITLADGQVSNFDIEAPAMKAGGKYEITLNYQEMRAYMDLSSCVINSWTEGWTYNSEILNPEQENEK